MTDAAEAVDVQEVPEEPKPEFVTLYMKRERAEDLGYEDVNANLVYGPHPRHTPEGVEGNIQFVNRYAVVKADHPLLAEVLEKYPVEIVVTEDKTRVFVDTDGKEYKSERALKTAQRAKKNKRKG